MTDLCFFCGVVAIGGGESIFFGWEEAIGGGENMLVNSEKASEILCPRKLLKKKQKNKKNVFRTNVIAFALFIHNKQQQIPEESDQL